VSGQQVAMLASTPDASHASEHSPPHRHSVKISWLSRSHSEACPRIGPGHGHSWSQGRYPRIGHSRISTRSDHMVWRRNDVGVRTSCRAELSAPRSCRRSSCQ
jgi:hypothetical protein